MTALFLIGFVLAYVLGTMQTAWAIRRNRDNDALARISRSLGIIHREQRLIGAAAMLRFGRTIQGGQS